VDGRPNELGRQFSDKHTPDRTGESLGEQTVKVFAPDLALDRAG
jgi:hypothetical protein